MTARSIDSFRDGDRVRDERDGSTGTVRFLDLTPDELASGEYEEAEVVWDDTAFEDGLSLAAPHLVRI